MQVRELIEALEMAPDDAEVRIAHQPSWPLQYNVGQVVDTSDVDPDECQECGGYLGDDKAVLAGDPDVGHDEGCSRPDRTAGDVVYIAEAGQVYDAPYLPGTISRELGWR